jgi:hypothetical protein
MAITQLGKLYESLQDEDLIRQMFVSPMVGRDAKTFRKKIREWSEGKPLNKETLLKNYRKELNGDPLNPNQTAIRVTLVKGNPVKGAFDNVKPENIQYEGNDIVQLDFYLPSSLVDDLELDPLFHQALRDPLINAYEACREKIEAKLRLFDAAITLLDENPNSEQAQHGLIDANDAYEDAIISAKAELEASAEKIINDSWDQLKNRYTELKEWKRSVAKEVVLGLGGAVVAGIGASGAAGPVGFFMGIWGLIKSINKMFMALIRFFESLKQSYAVAREQFRSICKKFETTPEWQAGDYANEVGSGFFTFLFGLPGFPRIKDVVTELDNCIGKAASVFITCQGLSVKLNDLLKKIDQGKTILKNPLEYGLDEGDKEYFKPLLKDLYGETNRLLVDISNKMEPVTKCREWAMPARDFAKDLQKKRPGVLKAFDGALVLAEVALTWAGETPPNPEDLVNVFAGLCHEVKTRYDDGHM